MMSRGRKNCSAEWVRRGGRPKNIKNNVSLFCFREGGGISRSTAKTIRVVAKNPLLNQDFGSDAGRQYEIQSGMHISPRSSNSIDPWNLLFPEVYR